MRSCVYTGVEITAKRYGFLIGKQADSEWLQVVPWGLRKLLIYVQQRYGDPDIYITESGVDVPNENQLPLDKALKDTFRTDYFKARSHAAMSAACVMRGVSMFPAPCLMGRIAGVNIFWK